MTQWFLSVDKGCGSASEEQPRTEQQLEAVHGLRVIRNRLRTEVEVILPS
jgi:hypothetical protein